MPVPPVPLPPAPVPLPLPLPLPLVAPGGTALGSWISSSGMQPTSVRRAAAVRLPLLLHRERTREYLASGAGAARTLEASSFRRRLEPEPDLLPEQERDLVDLHYRHARQPNTLQLPSAILGVCRRLTSSQPSPWAG